MPTTALHTPMPTPMPRTKCAALTLTLTPKLTPTKFNTILTHDNATNAAMLCEMSGYEAADAATNVVDNTHYQSTTINYYHY